MVTNLPNPTVRKVVEIYKRRWWIEVMIKELKGVVGLGQHQVTREPNQGLRIKMRKKNISALFVPVPVPVPDLRRFGHFY